MGSCLNLQEIHKGVRQQIQSLFNRVIGFLYNQTYGKKLLARFDTEAL